MEHLGDITKLDGGAIPAVHIITFGSPCQNLSKMGDRTGLAGAKSSLFYQAIRIIREMRDATGDQFPIIAVWENVGGAMVSMTGWIISPCSAPSSRTPKFQGLPLADGHMPEWCEGDALTWPGGSWTPSIGQGPGWPGGSGSSSWRILEGGVLERYCLSPANAPTSCLWPIGRAAHRRRDRGPSLEAGGACTRRHAFPAFRMREAAKRRKRTQFQNSFGAPNGPFSTLLAGTVTPFAFWYEDDPLGGCVSFPPQSGSVSGCWGCRMGGLSMERTVRPFAPPNGTGALGNAIALPCADYIMAGIAEALAGPEWKEADHGKATGESSQR